MKQEIIRVLRVIEYVGDRAAVEAHMKNVLYGEKTFPVAVLGKVTVKAATVGPVPEVLKGASTDAES